MTEQLGFNGFIARHMAAGLDRVFEVLHMDGWLDAELKCQSRHRHWTNRVCSDEVTHRASACTRPDGVLVCSAHAESKLRWMADANSCGGCDRPASDCWKIRPFG